MLELVKVILEIAGKALSPVEVSKMRKEKKLRQLGAELFLLYTHLNEILITGEEIIRGLESFVSKMDGFLERGNYFAPTETRIGSLIVRQRRSITKFGKSMQRYAEILQIIDADSYRKLQPLLFGKMNALGKLLEVMDRGQLPISEIELLLAEQAKYSFEPDKIREIIMENTISSYVEEEHVYQKIKEYLATKEPHRRLEEIRYILRQIRVNLEKNFSLQDILLEIGDRRFVAGHDKGFFW